MDPYQQGAPGQGGAPIPPAGGVPQHNAPAPMANAQQVQAMAMAMAAAQKQMQQQQFAQMQHAAQAQAAVHQKPAHDPGPPASRIYVAGIHQQTTRDQLDHVFSACGAVKDIVLVARKGIAFLEFDSIESAAEAVKYHGWTCSLLPNSHDPTEPAVLTVKYATPRQPLNPRPEHPADAPPADHAAAHPHGRVDPYAPAGSEAAPGHEAASHPPREEPEKFERKRERSPSPEPHPGFNKRVAADVADDLKAGGVNYGLAVGVLLHWLRTGECTQQTRDTMHGLLKAVYSGLESKLSIRGLLKAEVEQFLREAGVAQGVVGQALDESIFDLLSKGQKTSIKKGLGQIQRHTATAQSLMCEHFGGGPPPAAAPVGKAAADDDDMDTGEEGAAALEARCARLAQELADVSGGKVASDAANLRRRLEGLKASLAKEKADAQRAVDEAEEQARLRASALAEGSEEEQDQALKGVLSVWLAAKPAGATVEEMVAYIGNIAPQCGRERLVSLLQGNGALFGTLGKAGVLWCFKGFEHVS